MPDNEFIIRSAWLMDGATTLTEAAHYLREEAERLERFEREGWQLARPVQEDYGYVIQQKAMV